MLARSVFCASAALLFSCSSAPATTYTYVGTVDASDAVVGLAVTGDNANLFFCGTGSTLTVQTHWIPGNVTFGQTFTVTDGTATATGTATTTHASGTFTPTPTSPTLTWSADIVAAGTLAGVYDEQNDQGNAALVVLQGDPNAMPVAQGAYLPISTPNAVLQVTPYTPLTVTPQGIEVTVPVGGMPMTWYLPAATGN
jgi:hypothetical protein